jgi:hypothetical protein
MDAAEWEACGDPWRMLQARRQPGISNGNAGHGDPEGRSTRLACCAVARWRLSFAGAFAGRAEAEAALAEAESFALGRRKHGGRRPEPLRRACWLAEGAAAKHFRRLRQREGERLLERDAPAWARQEAMWACVAAAGSGAHFTMQSCRHIEATAAGLVRETCLAPSRAPPPPPCAAALSLARAAVEAREGGLLDGARLLVLSDALEEAGCADEALLAHLRRPWPLHHAGCWAVFSLLGLGGAA